MSRSDRTPSRRTRASGRPASAGRRTLVVIDARPLHEAAWAELQAARRRHNQAARNLHRHEEVDVPAFEAWLHRTFPLQITELRELHEEVSAKAVEVENVQAMAAFTGRSSRRLWRDRGETAAPPPDPDDPPGEAGGADDALPAAESAPRPPAEASADARGIYRRLVQRLHPDRGGSWTAARQRLWHEVQQAWASGDADWLARLEAEWDAAHESIGLWSPLSRLYRAIEELHAARRDTERKLRSYRGSPPWRFTRTAAARDALYRRVAANFEHDLEFLQRQLAWLNAKIAAWEEDWTRPSRRPRAPRRGNAKG